MATPMMQQWHACKEAAKGALLLFRMGDFYEAFYEDAQTLAKEIELTLTKRQGIPMSGVPVHTLENYLDKLISKGFRVAVAEQTEDPKLTKGIVKREVVRVVTPGTLMDSGLISDQSNNYIASITKVGSIFGLAYLDLTTAEFKVIEFLEEQQLLNEIYRIRTSEFVTSNRFYSQHKALFDEIRLSSKALINTIDDWRYEHQVAYDFLVKHLKVHNLDGFGLHGNVVAINAAGALLNYLQDDLCLNISHIQEVKTYSTTEFMHLDRTTQRNLELTDSVFGGKTLFSILNHTETPMGGRLLRNWIKQPLLNPAQIAMRQEAIHVFVENQTALKQVRHLLDGVRDLERLMIKMSSALANPRDVFSLRTSLERIPHLKQAIPQKAHLLQELTNALHPLPELTQRIAQALNDEPPIKLSDGGVIREGYYQELDELRALSRDSKSWIAKYQEHLKETTGIRTLKVGFTRVFGYYIEVSKGQAHLMPETFQRRQTLVNAERYLSPELKEYESKVMTAEEKISSIESALFSKLREDVAVFSKEVLASAQAIAGLDALQSLAEAAIRNNYNRPFVDDSFDLHIEEGRHPVIEAAGAGEKFIPNDTLLDNEKNRALIITGPNMAGKSTYIRQVALLTIMAQMGSFVPAKGAKIGIVDKVFTRIGASDDLARGQSTFMVEMTETANILNNATPRSLVILDEIGRGTSTYDGISIAWSVAEYLLTNEEKHSKTLFATHYWELTKLEEKVPGAVNYHVAVHENGDSIVFLRKIVRGDTDKSYGIHVGRLAGLPSAVIERAREILLHLEENANQKGLFEPSQPKKRKKKKPVPSDEMQLTLFG